MMGGWRDNGDVNDGLGSRDRVVSGCANDFFVYLSACIHGVHRDSRCSGVPRYG